MQQLLVLAILFFLTVPGVLVTLPRGGSKYVVAATHAVVFAALYFLTYRYVLEGLTERDAANNAARRAASARNSKAYR